MKKNYGKMTFICQHSSHFQLSCVEPNVLSTHPILILNDVISNGGQRGPFAVVGGADSTALMGLELTDCGAQINKRNIRGSDMKGLLN